MIHPTRRGFIKKPADDRRIDRNRPERIAGPKRVVEQRSHFTLVVAEPFSDRDGEPHLGPINHGTGQMSSRELFEHSLRPAGRHE